MAEEETRRNAWYIIAGGLAVALVLLVLFRPHNGNPVHCIEAPKVSDQSSQKVLDDHALKLEKLHGSGDLKRNFEEQSKVLYAALSEKETALLLLLRAIECYIKMADTPEKRDLVKQIAPELVQIARAMWAAEHGMRGDAKSLSVREKDLLKSSRYADELLSSLHKFGVD